MIDLPIRPGMDVYDAYQHRYIGVVVKVHHGPAEQRPASGAAEASQVETETPVLQHEQGGAVSPTETIGSKKLGEEMGPFPTIAVGNRGPVKQSAQHAYATGAYTVQRPLLWFTVRRGRINLGSLAPVIHIAATAVRSVSMERIILEEGWPPARR